MSVCFHTLCSKIYSLNAAGRKKSQDLSQFYHTRVCWHQGRASWMENLRDSNVSTEPKAASHLVSILFLLTRGMQEGNRSQEGKWGYQEKMWIVWVTFVIFYVQPEVQTGSWKTSWGDTRVLCHTPYLSPAHRVLAVEDQTKARSACKEVLPKTELPVLVTAWQILPRNYRLTETHCSLLTQGGLHCYRPNPDLVQSKLA